FPDAYSAMQTGVVDGVELPVDFIYNNRFQDLGKFLIETDHYIYANFLIINADFFNDLPEDLQQVIEKAGVAAGQYQTELVISQENEIIEKLKASGVTVVPVDKDAFREAVQPVLESKMEIWGRDLYDEIQASGRN